MLQRIKYIKGKIKKHYGVKYRVYQSSPDAWFWETRKWLMWARYPHACYENAQDAESAAKNCIKACAEGERIF